MYENPMRRHDRTATHYIHLGRAFKSYAKRYRSPGAPAGDATQRKSERQKLARRLAAERRRQTIRRQSITSDRDRNTFPNIQF